MITHDSILTCQELVELVTDYLEAQLPEALRERFEYHLAHCVGCQHYLAQMRYTIRMTGTLVDPTLSEHTRTALLTMFQNWKKEQLHA